MEFEVKLFVTHDERKYQMFDHHQVEGPENVVVVAGNGPLKTFKRCEGTVVNAYSAVVTSTKCLSGNYYIECKGFREHILVKVDQNLFHKITKKFSSKNDYKVIIYTLDGINWHLYGY